MVLAAAGCADESPVQNVAALQVGRDRLEAVEIAETSEPSPLAVKPAEAGHHEPDSPSADHGPLHNLHELSDRIYSGGEPADDEAFQAIADLGVKTVVSVDGIRPNIEAARKHGLEYVHIPIGYDGIEEEQAAMLTRLVRDRKGPFYVHCHHGRHRGPAAAAVACIASGSADNAGGIKILERAGTSRNYAGLWRDVGAFRLAPAGAALPELVEVAEVSSLAAAMAEIDRVYDRLVLSKDAGWKAPAEHPDVVPAQEALQLKERFHEVGRTLSPDFPQEFRDLLGESESTATDLETSLKASRGGEADKLLQAIEASCKACHAEHRD